MFIERSYVTEKYFLKLRLESYFDLFIAYRHLNHLATHFIEDTAHVYLQGKITNN